MLPGGSVAETVLCGSGGRHERGDRPSDPAPRAVTSDGAAEVRAALRTWEVGRPRHKDGLSVSVAGVRAYIDESLRNTAPGLYVLAAVAVSLEQSESVRQLLRDGLRHRRPRFHWTDEEPVDREAMAKTVGGLKLSSVVAIATPMNKHKPERARKVCLTRLLWELQQREVHDILLESRQESRDRVDRAHILHAQKAHHLTSALRYGHALPLEEPLLWLPDLVAGAVSYARAGQEQFLQLLGAGVSIVDAGSGS